MGTNTLAKKAGNNGAEYKHIGQMYRGQAANNEEGRS